MGSARVSQFATCYHPAVTAQRFRALALLAFACRSGVVFHLLLQQLYLLSSDLLERLQPGTSSKGRTSR